MFSVSTLIIAMNLKMDGFNGLALGAWGAVQATAAGLSIAAGGMLRDGTALLGQTGSLGPVFKSSVASYNIVYHLEIFLLFGTLIALGPLVRRLQSLSQSSHSSTIGLAELPG